VFCAIVAIGEVEHMGIQEQAIIEMSKTGEHRIAIADRFNLPVEVIDGVIDSWEACIPIILKPFYESAKRFPNEYMGSPNFYNGKVVEMISRIVEFEKSLRETPLDATLWRYPLNPRSLPDRLVSALVSADRCAKCLGELDTGWECNECGFDWKPWIDASKAKHEATHNNREG
jgi:hypothetical protein